MKGSRPVRARLRTFVIVTVGIMLLCVLLLGTYAYRRLTRRYDDYFHRRDSPPRVEESEPGYIRLIARDGRTVRGRLRLPTTVPPPWAGVVLMGGIRTGHRAADLIPNEYVERGIAILSLDYHLVGSLPLPGRGAAWHHYLRYPPHFEASVEDIIDAADYLATRPDIDEDKLVLVGVSFGIFFVPAAMAAQPQYDALAIVYGGAPMGRMAAHNFTVLPAWSRSMVGTLVDILVAPLEPTRHLPNLGERPTLYLVSRQDEQIPLECVSAVEEAIKGPKTLIYLETRHVNPKDTKLIASLASKAMDWVDERIVQRR